MRSEFAPGDWIRFIEDVFIAPENILLRGMLGRIAKPIPHVCTPGVSALCVPVGAEWPYGYACRWMEVLPAEPTPSELEAAAELWRTALDRWTDRYGFTGWVHLKDRHLPIEHVCHELKALCDRLDALPAGGQPEGAFKGAVRQMGRILKACHRNPNARAALHLADELNLWRRDPTAPPVCDLLNAIREWAARASHAGHIETQEEALHRALREGTAVIESEPWEGDQ